MTRFPDWAVRLETVVARHKALPFSWGGSDCFTLPLAAIAAMTGSDPSAGLRTYDDARSAQAALTAAGFADIGAAFASHLPEIHPVRAGRGDIGTTTISGRVTGLIVIGAQVVAKAEFGVAVLSRSVIERAFTV